MGRFAWRGAGGIHDDVVTHGAAAGRIGWAMFRKHATLWIKDNSNREFES